MDLVDGLFSTDWLIHILVLGQCQPSKSWVGEHSKKGTQFGHVWGVNSQGYRVLTSTDMTFLFVDLRIDCSIDLSLALGRLFGCLVDESNVFK